MSSAKRVALQFLKARNAAHKRRVLDTAAKFKEVLLESSTSAEVNLFDSGYVGIIIQSPKIGKWMYLDQPGVVGFEDQTPGFVWFGPHGPVKNGLVEVRHPIRRFGDVDFTDDEVQKINERVFDEFRKILRSKST